MTDHKDDARRATRAFEAAGDRLAERGLSDADIGRALVAAGLSRWSRAVGAEVLADELARLTAGVSAVVRSDIDERSPSPLR